MEEIVNIIDTIQESFETVKDIDWTQATVSLYIVKRRLRNRSASYTVNLVNIQPNLGYKLRNIASNKIEASNEALEYDFNTSDLDDNVLGIEVEDTDLKQILIDINSAEPVPTVNDMQDLLNSWVYIARLDVEGQEPLYTVRKISDGWKAKKIRQPGLNMIFSDNMLVDLEQQNIFKIDNQVDFFSFNGTIFIANKRNFESALNFRNGMEKNRDEIIEEFKTKNLFVNADEIKKLIGDSLPRLRKLSQVKKAGYYLDQDFLTGLQMVSEDEEWDISYSEDGKMIVTEDNIDSVLVVLNNGRLTSKINDESFDVDVKHKYDPSK
ncbi:Kiwa anti-phage protein KwaB-like domain-containing protein [Marinifilum sp. D737]|uniref:Kiwa anti-phage protein KwaB-like domain-containing protein n=1 Tax=Marinifilum sp. D737 TaxID=2969628 RepID=UPI0022758818|nr:Kiwa anti-phage protein KwaB-like domain-containing protein [Marinifilum sp. D737]MCY1636392.1 DUF4868 domain-containing protein [Marinifilum sp. D737]